MKNLEQANLSPLSDKDFEEIIRRIVNEHFKVFFSEERYYKVLSEIFLQECGCDLDSFGLEQHLDSDEDGRKRDEWLAFRRVYFELMGRPGHHPLKEIFEPTWVAYFKAWILSDTNESSVIDWICSTWLFGKGRTRKQIAELLDRTLVEQDKHKSVQCHNEQDVKVEKLVEKEHFCNEQYTSVNKGEAVEDVRKVTEQTGSGENIDRQKRTGNRGRPRNGDGPSLQALLGIENYELWQKLLPKLQECQDKHSKAVVDKQTTKSLIVYALLEARYGKELNDCNKSELYAAYKKEKLSAIGDSTFRNAYLKKDDFDDYKLVVKAFERTLKE